MTFLDLYLQGLALIVILMTSLWIVSVFLKNVSIVDLFWGVGFIILGWFYFLQTEGNFFRKSILVTLLTLWGLRLSGYLTWRNYGKGEDFRYREFRKRYGEKRYSWVSYFQTFLLQGVLLWLISAPLLGAQYFQTNLSFTVFDALGIISWIIGIVFEAGGDYQLARFKKNPENKGKVLNTGLWRFTRHPNYFGDSMVWWGYGLLCAGGGSYLPLLSSLLMTVLLLRVSGVSLLEKSLRETKSSYREYSEKTNTFFPWFPKK